MRQAGTQSPVLVVADGVHLRPADDIAEAEEGDCVIEREGLRQPPRLAGAATVALLNRFRTPARLPEAIAHLSTELGTDPYALLAEALPVIADLVESHILEEPSGRRRRDRSLVAGTTVAGCEITKVLRCTRDTEVALAMDASGDPVCVKTLRPGAPAAAAALFANEINISRQLHGGPTAEVLQVEGEDVEPVLVTRWHDGMSLDRYVAALAGDKEATLAVTARVVEAFADLHARGVLHGDIRPSNILIDGYGRPILIDFGLSQWRDANPLRLGFELSSMEPEAAAAFLADGVAPLTEKGEVFTLAVVLSEVIGGDVARPIPALRDDALRSVATTAVRIRTGLPQLDDVLLRAASPSADDRPSMSDLGRALASLVLQPGPAHSDVKREEPDLALDDAALDVLRAAHYSDGEYLARARQRIELSRKNDFPSADRSDPLHSPVATTLLQAKIAYACRDFHVARAHCDEIPLASTLPSDRQDLFSGRAGELAHLARFLTDYACVDAAVTRLRPKLEARLEETLAVLARRLNDLREDRPCHLGMAHGLAGHAYAALLAAESLGRPPEHSVEKCLARLADEAQPFGAASAWPGSLNVSDEDVRCADFAPGWCNGTAGFLILWNTAARVLRTRQFEGLETASARFTFAHPDASPNLCCGLAGRAVALCRHAEEPGRGHWRVAARTLLDRAKSIPLTVDSGSILRGSLGLEYAELRLEGRGETCFPI